MAGNSFIRSIKSTNSLAFRATSNKKIDPPPCDSYQYDIDISATLPSELFVIDQ